MADGLPWDLIAQSGIHIGTGFDHRYRFFNSYFDGLFACSSDADVYAHDIPPPERWEQLDCANTWVDALDVFRQYDRPSEISFIESMSVTLLTGVDCGWLGECPSLSKGCQCYRHQEQGTTSGGNEVMHSLVKIHIMLDRFYNAIVAARSATANSHKAFIDTFAAMTDYCMTCDLFMDALGLLVPTTMGSAFYYDLLSTNYFTAYPYRVGDLMEAIDTLIASWTNTVKDGRPSDFFNERSSDPTFMAFMSDIWSGWLRSTEAFAAHLFNGTDDAIHTLGTLIQNGQLISGSTEGNVAIPPMEPIEIQLSIERAYYGFIIPRIWRSSSTKAFVIDAGHECEEGNPISDPFFDDDATVTLVCFENKVYYIASPDNPRPDTCQFPGTPASTVRSYRQNGNKNGWTLKRLQGNEQAEDFDVSDMLENNIAASGFSTLPLCGAEEANLNWAAGRDTQNYPCN
ncbi:hypothetical protein BDV26DRAFT_288551 [Aspergillus bertholletiae]|uniref:Uncharacterized protein n=1 Tax=Aspergillus bertholletiae TaxID=1226010 RepID=A0A5N7BL62_9EURO|nr:hypothetical protein BDV26DRAFT_288551 [Aspergillus bertholletiae]